MKKLLLFLPLFLLLSCSVQKRKYQSGYYVSWHAKNSKKESFADRSSHKPQNISKKEVSEVLVTEQEKKTEEELPPLNLKTPSLQKTLKSFAPPEDTCDVLVFKDGSEIKGKVKEVGVNEIKYKRCDTPDGPTYVSRNADVFMIKYANGTREVIKSEPQQRVQSPEPVKNRNPNTNSELDYRKTRYNRQIHPLAVASLLFAILAIVILYAALIFSSGGMAFPATALILPFIFSLIAVICGISAMRRIKEQPDLWKGKGMALPGMIMGMVIASIYLLILFIVLLAYGI